MPQMTTSTANALDRLTPKVGARLAEVARSIAYPAGAVVLREGVDTPFLGSIIEGRIALRLRVPELGNRLTMVTVEPGELIGWSAVVPPYRATVDAIATEPTRVLAFDAPALREQLAADCELAAELLPLVLELVSHRLTASWQQLLDALVGGAPEPW
jgi:CRP/FNR family transcriptional regulator, cyclic AMP receptor protein